MDSENILHCGWVLLKPFYQKLLLNLDTELFAISNFSKELDIPDSPI